MVKEKACRVCHYILIEGDTCPKCGSKTFTTFWKGFVVIFNPEISEIAKKMGISLPGKYALRISR